MKKKYNIFIISRLYLKNYYKFLITKTDIVKTEEAYSLFMYSMKKLYSLDTIEYNDAIEKHSKECIKYLKETPNTPKDKRTLSFEERVHLISVCEGYAKAMGILTRKVIENGRIE